MRVKTEEKVEKDFMIIRSRFYFAFAIIAITTVLQTSSCNPNITDDPMPYAAFGSVYINLNLPAYTHLKSDGGYYYYDNAGVKGLIIYRQNASSYVVYERNCSYKPNEACATVNVHASTLFMEDPCCGSAFDFVTGNPTSGAAWRPLRKYFSVVTGSDLTITDEIIN
jgi:hypothetical protein